MYAVIEFAGTDAGGCEVVPLKWISGDQKFCTWPPRNLKKSVELQLEPEQTWTSYSIKLIYFCGKFCIAFLRKTLEPSILFCHIY